MVDMAPELLQQIQSDWSDNLKNDAEIKSLIEKINEGKATYKEVEDLSYRVGKDLSKSLLDNITEDILPNGHVPQNVAEKILHPTLNNAHNLVTNVAVKVQEDMNEAAGIGLKAQKTDYNEEKAQGLVHKLTNGQFEDTKWILDEPVTLFVQSVADNTLKKNVDFQAHSGLKPQIIRKASSNCCSWCSDLEGTYDYGSEPKDVYRRHERCKCSVDYNPGNGKRQDVWSKEWHEDADSQNINNRIEANEQYQEMKKYNSPIGKLASNDMERITPIKNTPEEIKNLIEYGESQGVNVVRPDKLHGNIEMAKEQISMVAKYSKEYKIDPPAIRFESMDLDTLGYISKKATSIAVQNNAMRDRTATNNYLNSDKKLAATDARGISVHEMGHVLAYIYGDNGIEIATKTYYNLYKETISFEELNKWLRENISEYSIVKGELISEVLSKDETNPDSFTKEFITLLKEGWEI